MKGLFCFILLIVPALAVEPASLASEAGSRYKLRPLDVVEVRYRYTPEFDHSGMIQTDGYISLPLLGSVPLAGLTVNEAQTTLQLKAAVRLIDPELSFVLKEFEKPYFIVQGEVGTPGRYDMRGKMSALQAVAIAGGLKSATAKHSQILWFRRVDNDWAETRIINFKDIVSQHGEDVEVRSGDMLIVPQNRISKIERFMRWGSVGVFLNPLSR